MRVVRALLVLLALLAAFPVSAAEPDEYEFWYAAAPDGTPVVRLHFFWTASCPHCRRARPFVEALPAAHPWIEVVSHSMDDEPGARDLYLWTGALLDEPANSVPGFAFCRRIETGFDQPDTTGAWLVEEMRACRAELMAAEGGAAPAAESAQAAGGAPVILPVVGPVSTQRWSLPVLTLVLAGLDAFNPCAFFVLLFLLSLLVHANSRSRMLLVGGVFVLFSGLIYFAFMAAWLNLFLLAGELRAVTVAAGMVALFVGAVHAKDYFRFREGLSLSIPESARPGLFRRMREVVGAASLGPMLAGTVLLAIAANAYEALCTAGFPMVYTRALTLHDLGAAGYYGYLALYNLIYVIPLAAIVGVFAWTMGARKLTEREGRVLKLASGYMMLALGLVLLAAPGMLTNALASAGVLAAALGAAAVTVLLGRASNGSSTPGLPRTR